MEVFVIKKLFSVKRFLSTLLVAIIFSSFVSVNIKAVNQRWYYTFETPFYLNSSGWKARYGGAIDTTRETAYEGDKCLKMTGRTESWHSPALKLNEIFEQGGAGIYSISVYVKVSTLDDDALRFGRSIIRGFEDTSFIDLRGTNYFCPVASATINPNEWVCLQGDVRVTSQDIHRGEFFWMLDCIDATEGQVIYIDNFSIFKTSDSTALMDTPLGIVYDITGTAYNDRAFLDYYMYDNMPAGLTRNSAAAWYFEKLSTQTDSSSFETVFTFTPTQANQLNAHFVNMELDDWWSEQITTEITASLNIASTVFSVYNSKIGEFYDYVSTAADLIDSFNQLNNLYFSDVQNFANRFANACIDNDIKTQEYVTISVYLLRTVLTPAIETECAYEYKIVRSDDRGELSRERYGLIDYEMYSFLMAYCSRVMAGNYDIPVQTSYFQRPAINKVIHRYSYLKEYQFKATYPGGLYDE